MAETAKQTDSGRARGVWTGLREYRKGDAEAWDTLVNGAAMGCFIHSRRFLAYHGERFNDQSLVFENERGNLVGVFPAAVDPDDSSHVISHPGITWGGLVHGRELLGGRALDVLASMQHHYRAKGFERLTYKVVPTIYHRRPSQDDLYALQQSGADLVRCDLSCAIDLEMPGAVSERRRRALRKAQRAGVTVSASADFLEPFWVVLADALRDRHGVAPVHSYREMRLLMELFPDNIRLYTAQREGRVIAGVVMFIAGNVGHAQYMACHVEGRTTGALDLVIRQAIDTSQSQDLRYFDFGISTTDGGQVLNDGLYTYKKEYGGSGVVHAFYEIDLTGGRQ